MTKEFKIEGRQAGHSEWEEISRVWAISAPDALDQFSVYESHRFPGVELRAEFAEQEPASPSTRKFEILGIDRGATAWDEFASDDPKEVLDVLDRLRSHANGRTYWVHDPDDPERGDIEDELFEILDS